MGGAAPWLVLLLALGLPGPAAALTVTFSPPSPRQGDVVVVRLAGVRPAQQAAGSLGGRPLLLFPHGDGYAALAGIDLDARPGETAWDVVAPDGGGRRHVASGRLVVRSREFAVQRLTLPRHMVELDPETERRAAAEAQRLQALYDTVTPERLWRGRFLRPVPGEAPGEGFGLRRIINGLPRSPHSGIDFAADRGTPVVAGNRGRVALVAEFFFAGRLVVLDHGLGLYTLYFHLEGVDVAEGALVEQGQPVGSVGATGRATGPHLHFGVQLGRARVDPSMLFALPLGD